MLPLQFSMLEGQSEVLEGPYRLWNASGQKRPLFD